MFPAKQEIQKVEEGEGDNDRLTKVDADMKYVCLCVIEIRARKGGASERGSKGGSEGIREGGREGDSEMVVGRRMGQKRETSGLRTLRFISRPSPVP